MTDQFLTTVNADLPRRLASAGVAKAEELTAEQITWASSFLRSLLNRHNIADSIYDDLFSAGFLGLLNAAREFNSDLKRPFRAFASTCMRSSVTDQFRRLTAEKRFAGRAEMLTLDEEDSVCSNSLSNTVEQSPERLASDRQIGVRLHKALYTLKPIEYAVVKQHVAEDRTFAAIAANLSLRSRTEAFKIYQRAIRALRITIMEHSR